ncbi:MAG: beta-phosphoglucomutase [Bacilli bacterium]
MHSKHLQKKPIYPFDEWEIIENSFDVETNGRNETIFALGNGYIGMRGNFEEGFGGPAGMSLEGIYLNGFYESEPIRYGEDAHGYARYSQTMLNVTNSRIIQLTVDGEPFDLFHGKILQYKRVLDMKNGILTRTVDWESPAGKQVRIHARRIVCLSRKHLAAFSYEATPLNFDGTLTIASALDGDVHNQTTLGDPRVGSAFRGQVLITEEKIQDRTFGALLQKTQNTKFELVCAMENELTTENSFVAEGENTDQQIALQYRIDAKLGIPVRLTKFVSYHTSKDYPQKELQRLAKEETAAAKELGFDSLAKEQQAFLNAYWRQSDVEIRGDAALLQSLRFNAFHLLQSVGRDGKTNIAAKGVTGEGYEGHYFWDTETYIFPFFLYTHPDISKRLLEYRFSILDKARTRAREMAQKGALYAWRTIDGEETSPYYPAGTAAYHINADIIYALRKYMRATDDSEFFLRAGAEMLFETARFWVDLGDYIPKMGNRFCINGVTGPDEYTALVNNNFYTNLMAKDHLEYAHEMAVWMRLNHPSEYQALAEKIHLEAIESDEWKRAADAMYLPYDGELGIYAQDDTFLQKAMWDFERTPPDHYPLLLHYHPLVIYRHQVIKQADVVLALFLQGNRFNTAEKKRNYDYYETITTHDSSLSPCIYSIIGAEVGYLQKAYDYFLQTARMDLDDYNGNVKDGIHSASMAGAWLSIVNGFAGFREYGGQLWFNPRIPAKWESYRFKIAFRGRLLVIEVDQRQVVYRLLEGEAITIRHGNLPLELPPQKEFAIASKTELEAVIFDLDGVVTDTAEYHFRAWKQLADGLGLPFDRAVNERLKGIGRMESLDIILEQSGTSFTEQEKAVFAARKNEYYQQLIQGIAPHDLLPGIEQLLKELKQNRVKIGLASASKNVFTVVHQLQAADYFDVIVDPAKLQKGKPDPEIFMTAAELLGVPYRNCVGVEDAEAGVDAIHAAGMFAVGVGTKSAMRKSDWAVADPAQITFERLRERFEQSRGVVQNPVG